ncbi:MULTISPECIES: hypothetical protein [unclassified Streptomyces]|uniref:Uncharacterized protein n=1 Tax=Streptomyces sp. NBC_00060 TaxID=2975636 RepID=A0AAU2H239_9ACTN
MSNHGVPTDRQPAERWFSVAVAARVNSVVSVFFEKHARQEDAFAAVQAVESAWRETGGQGEEAEFQQESVPLVDRLRERAAESGRPSGAAVAAALEATRAVAAFHGDGDPRVREVQGAALAVALEFDRNGVAPPEGHPCWLAFESAGQAELASRVFARGAGFEPRDAFELRMASGEESMHYREAILSWMRDTH